MTTTIAPARTRNTKSSKRRPPVASAGYAPPTPDGDDKPAQPKGAHHTVPERDSVSAKLHAAVDHLPPGRQLLAATQLGVHELQRAHPVEYAEFVAGLGVEATRTPTAAEAGDLRDWLAVGKELRVLDPERFAAVQALAERIVVAEEDRVAAVERLASITGEPAAVFERGGEARPEAPEVDFSFDNWSSTAWAALKELAAGRALVAQAEDTPSPSGMDKAARLRADAEYFFDLVREKLTELQDTIDEAADRNEKRAGRRIE